MFHPLTKVKGFHNEGCYKDEQSTIILPNVFLELNMSLYLDTKYLMLLSIKLRNFKKVSDDVYHASCEICGDSKKDTTKARGYFYKLNDKLCYKCHNCGVSMTFAHYLKTVDQSLYKQYVFESLKSNQQQKIVEQDLKQKVIIDSLRAKKTMVTSDLIVDSVLDYATRVDRLDDSHPCKQYVTGRMIGRDKWPLLYYTDDFKQFTNRFIPGKFKNGHDYLIDKEERLVIPFFDRHGKVTAFQGRSLDPHSKIRYYTIRLDETKPTIYGLERVDYSKPIYVCEAALDSLFIPNCISVNGACYQDPLIEQIKTNLTIIPDNERRNKEVCRQIEKMINGGFKVCLWPEGLPFKDINEAIQVGYTTDEMLQIINDNVVCGLSGRIKFKLWTK